MQYLWVKQNDAFILNKNLAALSGPNELMQKLLQHASKRNWYKLIFIF
jgi:hypothetical protein